VSIVPQSVQGSATETIIFLCFAHQAYLHVVLGKMALRDGEVPEFGTNEVIPLPELRAYNIVSAVDHFTAAVNASSFFFGSPIHTKYEVFTEVR
jgi:hypothetical protein